MTPSCKSCSWFHLQDDPANFKLVMVPTIALVVMAYGILGGLAAAYWTDLLQGLSIILLSCILIPYGLWALVDKYGDQYVEQIGPRADMTMMDGFAIMHDRVTNDYFGLFSGPEAGEFPWYFIASLTALALMGIVVQPHFIAVGGGSAKTENSARVGLVTGNFLKRLCTIGWGLTALIALALLAGNVNATDDPERVWGIASREILGPIGLGLVGLMLACLIAAAMSSADAYMLVTSALLVRNVYAPYFNPDAEEKTYIRAGRIAGVIIIVGAAAVSMLFYNTFKQYILALEVAIVFAAPFWIGMYWRRASKVAAWATIAFSLGLFFVAPALIPRLYPALRENQNYAITNDIVTRVTDRPATQVDVDRREAEIAVWKKRDAAVTAAQQEVKRLQSELAAAEAGDASDIAALKKDLAKAQLDLAGKTELRKKLDDKHEPLTVGEKFNDTFTTKAESIFWTGGVKPVGEKMLEVVDSYQQGDTKVTEQRHTGKFTGQGWFNLDFLVYQLCGVDLRKANKATLATLRLPPRLITPFVVMILLSFVTPRPEKKALDRYYVKMKTPVRADRAEDERELEESYANPSRFDHRRLLPFFGLEIQKPTRADILGFAISVGICFVFLWLAQFVANIGS